MDSMLLPVTVGRHRVCRPLLIVGFLMTLTLGCLGNTGALHGGQLRPSGHALGIKDTTSYNNNNRVGQPIRTVSKDNLADVIWWRHSTPTASTAGLRTGSNGNEVIDLDETNIDQINGVQAIDSVDRGRNNRQRRSSVSWLLATTLRMCKNYPDDCLQMNSEGRRRSSPRMAAVNQIQARNRRQRNAAAFRRPGSSAIDARLLQFDLSDGTRRVETTRPRAVKSRDQLHREELMTRMSGREHRAGNTGNTGRQY